MTCIYVIKHGNLAAILAAYIHIKLYSRRFWTLRYRHSTGTIAIAHGSQKFMISFIHAWRVLVEKNSRPRRFIRLIRLKTRTRNFMEQTKVITNKLVELTMFWGSNYHVAGWESNSNGVGKIPTALSKYDIGDGINTHGWRGGGPTPSDGKYLLGSNTIYCVILLYLYDLWTETAKTNFENFFSIFNTFSSKQNQSKSWIGFYCQGIYIAHGFENSVRPPIQWFDRSKYRRLNDDDYENN